jgi:hypothetical protein
MTKPPKSWKTVQRELEDLRRKHGRDRSCVRSFPDLSTPKRGTPCTNLLKGGTPARGEIAGRKPFPVGNLHKSGLQMITPGDDPRAYAGNKVGPSEGYKMLLEVLENPSKEITNDKT